MFSLEIVPTDCSKLDEILVKELKNNLMKLGLGCIFRTILLFTYSPILNTYSAIFQT